jgi:hypothetical protein
VAELRTWSFWAFLGMIREVQKHSQTTEIVFARRKLFPIKNDKTFDIRFSSNSFVLSRVFLSDGGNRSSKILQKAFCKKIVSKGLYKNKKSTKNKFSKTDLFRFFCL